MKKATLVLCTGLLLGTASKVSAQVKDISFTVSPVAGYTIWDRGLNLGDSPFWGVRAGFGLSSFLELRGIYEQSFDLKSKLKSSSWSTLNNLADNLENKNVSVRRIGGELKFNIIPNTILSPYLTAGAGVLRLTYDVPGAVAGAPSTGEYKEEQLYGALGAGVKINLARRVALSLEAKNILFNTNSNNYYLAPNTSASTTLQNWTGIASLDFYFGGRTQTKDAVSRAYYNSMTDGFRGLKVVLEPGIMYLDFDSKSIMADQWMIGGSAGVDFTSFLGLRGFYYTSTQSPTTLNLKLNDYVQMYGGHLIGRLNYPQGVTPYVTLGGGYLDVRSNKYVDALGTNTAKSGWFAMGGAGLEIPLHRYVSLYGSVNALINEQENPDISQVTEPNQVKVNLAYQAGVRFNIGASARSGESVYKAYAEDMRLREHEANMAQLNKLRAQYEEKVNNLNEELATAIRYQDTLALTRIQLEQVEAEAKLREVEAKKAAERQSLVAAAKQETTVAKAVEVKHDSVVAPVTIPVVAKTAPAVPAGSVVLTASQLEELIARVVKNVQPQTKQPQSSLDQILLLLALQQGGYARPAGQPANLADLQSLSQQIAPTTAPQQAISTANDLTLQRLEQTLTRLESSQKELVQQNQELQSKVEQVQDKVDENKSQNQQMHIVNLSENKTPEVTTITSEYNEKTGKTEFKMDQVEVDSHKVIKFRSLSVFGGLNFGDDTAFNVGVRANHQIRNSNFDFTPELYLGFGKDTNFGLSLNAIYNIRTLKNSAVTPYAGLGFGYFHTNGTGRLNSNVILGASLNNVLGGKLFADYSIRGAFTNNQIAVGYRINF